VEVVHRRWAGLVGMGTDMPQWVDQEDLGREGDLEVQVCNAGNLIGALVMGVGLMMEALGGPGGLQVLENSVGIPLAVLVGMVGSMVEGGWPPEGSVVPTQLGTCKGELGEWGITAAGLAPSSHRDMVGVMNRLSIPNKE